MAQECFQVVGGAANGGIIVRNGKALDAKQDVDRLSTGSVVRAVEVDRQAGRVRYELVEGRGPATGWVSTRIQGRDMLVRQGGDQADDQLTN